MKFPEQYRFQMPPIYVSSVGDGFGCFKVPTLDAPCRRSLNIIACDGQDTGWDHVSVSLGPDSKTSPTWDEMCFVKGLFWDESDCVVQYHPAKNDYVNFHKGTLHLWKPLKETLPLPPKVCV